MKQGGQHSVESGVSRPADAGDTLETLKRLHAEVFKIAYGIPVEVGESATVATLSEGILNVVGGQVLLGKQNNKDK